MPHKKQASLFVVATPIGNFKDITHRAIEVLGSVTFIVSENVRKTKNLLAHYGIRNRVHSYREANSRRAIPGILKALGEGKSVALVAEAGTPGVSDPGRDLVDAAYLEGFAVVPVPGPSAVLAAVSAAGMSESRFVFEGFLPRRRSKRVKRLTELASDERLLVFFEAPHRLAACLADMAEVLGNRSCLVAREVTKMYEEMTRGGLVDLAREYSRTRPKGEFVIVCEGADAGARGSGSGPARDLSAAREEGLELLKEGMKRSEAAKVIAATYGLKRSDAYSLLARGPASDWNEKDI
jgi:16S rRNA (cytidine1402-2'-O)-methyltransferase